MCIRDSLMAVMRDDEIGFAVAGYGKGIVSRIGNFRLLSRLLCEVRHQWPNHVVGDSDHRESNRSRLQGNGSKRTMDDHAQRDAADEGHKVQAFHHAQYPRFWQAVRPAAASV